MENDPDEAPTLAATSGRSVYRIQGTPVYNNFTATAYANDSAHGLADYGILGLALDLDGGSLKYFFAISGPLLDYNCGPFFGWHLHWLTFIFIYNETKKEAIGYEKRSRPA